MQAGCFDYLSANGKRRIEGSTGRLRNVGDPLAPKPPQPRLRQTGQILAVEQDAAACERHALAQVPEYGLTDRGFSCTGFTYQSEHLPDVEGEGNIVD